MAGELLKQFPTMDDLFFQTTRVDNNHGSGSVSESRGGRIQDAAFADENHDDYEDDYDDDVTTDPDPCRKAEAGG